MSESDKKDLGGIARSIDSLFSSGPGARGETSEEETGPDESPPSAAAGADPRGDAGPSLPSDAGPSLSSEPPPEPVGADAGGLDAPGPPDLAWPEPTTFDLSASAGPAWPEPDAAEPPGLSWPEPIPLDDPGRPEPSGGLEFGRAEPEAPAEPASPDAHAEVPGPVPPAEAWTEDPFAHEGLTLAEPLSPVVPDAAAEGGGGADPVPPVAPMPPLEPVPPVEATPPVAPVAAGPVSAPPPHPRPGPDDDLEPGPLALAVESFLAGGGDAPRVRALAQQHMDAREYTPVAEAVERLVDGARDGDREALRVATDLLNPIVRSRIVQRLGLERSEERRERLHRVCTALGADMAATIRDEMSETGDRSARRAYFDALVAMGDVSRPVVEAMAEDDNRFLARNAVAILGEVGGPRAAELVVQSIANTDPRVRREALLAMARLKIDDADEIIVGRLVDDTDATVRQAATVAAGELRIERAVKPLIAALDGAHDADEVLPLLHALGQIGDPGAVTTIEKHAVRERFGKPRTEVRIAAYQALNHIGTPHARRLVNQAVSDKDSAVRAAVRELLHMH